MTDWATLNELIEATASAREVIREMHAATKDLKHAIAEARRVTREELEGNYDDKLREIGEEFIACSKEDAATYVERMKEFHNETAAMLVQARDATIVSMEKTARLVVAELSERKGDGNELAYWALDTLKQAREMMDTQICWDPKSGKERPMTRPELDALRANGDIPAAFKCP